MSFLHKVGRGIKGAFTKLKNSKVGQAVGKGIKAIGNSPIGQGIKNVAQNVAGKAIDAGISMIPGGGVVKQFLPSGSAIAGKAGSYLKKKFS